jgi:hypothetical protein
MNMLRRYERLGSPTIRKQGANKIYGRLFSLSTVVGRLEAKDRKWPNSEVWNAPCPGQGGISERQSIAGTLQIPLYDSACSAPVRRACKPLSL